MKKVAIKCLVSGVVFTLCYSIVSVIMCDSINMVNIIGTAVVYTVLMFLLSLVAPHLRKVFGFKEK